MYLAESSGADTYIATAPREVYDVTAAGDVVLTFFGFLAIAGLSFSSAATVANLAAGIEVGRIGAEIVSREDIALALRSPDNTYERKIVAADESRRCWSARGGKGGGSRLPTDASICCTRAICS